jgi:hypothetical protein
MDRAMDTVALILKVTELFLTVAPREFFHTGK